MRCGLDGVLLLDILFDFSGYSDMAIGLSRTMGFRLCENFNQPYLAHGFRDFWRRWHISLSTWIRDYLYIPLGGDRVPHWAHIPEPVDLLSRLRPLARRRQSPSSSGAPTTACS